MKEYDIYLAMTPSASSEDYMGALAVMLLNSGLKYTRHIGEADNLAARRDVKRLLDECSTILYVADSASNALELTTDIIEHAGKDGKQIVVVRTDDSVYPAAIAQYLDGAATFDATDPTTRKQAFAEAIRHLGGKADVTTPEKNPLDDPEAKGMRPTTPEAVPTAGPETVAEEETTDSDHIVKSGPSIAVIIVEIILGIVVIGGVLALILGHNG